MILSLFAIPVLFVLVLVLLRYGRTAGERATVVAPEPPAPAEVTDGPATPPLPAEWTALDDHQLNRLLRESSS